MTPGPIDTIAYQGLCQKLEEIIASDDTQHQATAYAALTLARLLAPQWTHVVTVREKGQEPRHERVQKPAGQTVGDRAGLVFRLTILLHELGHALDAEPKDGWTPAERDAWFQQFEKPGSYGLCWKLYDDVGAEGGRKFNCSKAIDHNGDCGEEPRP